MNSSRKPSRGNVLWKRIYPIDYLPDTSTRYSRMKPSKRLDTLVNWGLVYRRGENYYPNMRGKIRAIFSRGTNTPWDALSTPEKRRWCSRMIDIIIRQINEENPYAHISIRDVTTRKSARTFRVSVQERLEKIEDAVSAYLNELSAVQMRTTTDSGRRVVSEHIRRVRNIDSILNGISEMIEHGIATPEKVD